MDREKRKLGVEERVHRMEGHTRHKDETMGRTAEATNNERRLRNTRRKEKRRKGAAQTA
jgi:hypothetical protein